MRRTGFTLVELLVVIAIISLLAAIIFPAAIRAKDAAYRSSDMSHLNELRSALQLYRVDQGGYPPQLFGYVQLYASGANSGQAIPADQTTGTAPCAQFASSGLNPLPECSDFLFPKSVPALSTFQPAYDSAKTSAVVGGPNCGTAGNPPCVYWPGTAGAQCQQQAFGYSLSTPVTAVPYEAVSATNPPLEFYAVDGYDIAPVKEPDGTTQYELHYALFWTGYGIGGNQTGAGAANCETGGVPGSALDNPDQLGYNNPPDTTVITWDTYFRDYTGNAPTQYEKRDIVLFLGGSAKMYDSNMVAQNAWNLSP